MKRMPWAERQRACAATAAIRPSSRLDHGLVQQRELAVVQRGAQPGGQLGPAYDVCLHLGRVQLDPVLAAGLGAVHGQVGVAQQLAGAEAGLGEGDADGGGHPHLVAVDAVGLGEREPQPVGDLQYVALPGGRSRVPSPTMRAANSSPPSRAAVSPARTESWSLRAAWTSSSSPAWWPMRVVDGLEAVEVDEEHGRCPRRSRPGGRRAPAGRAW